MIKLNTHDKPATKAEAYNIVRRLVTQANKVHKSELHSLLLYFAPKPSKARLNSAQEFISTLVADKSDVRYYLCHMYSREGELQATDGYVAGWTSTNLEGGYYNASTGDTVEVSNTYPDFNKIKHENPTYIPFNFNSWERSEVKDNGKSMFIYIDTDGNRFTSRLMNKTLLRKGLVNVKHSNTLSKRGALQCCAIIEKTGETVYFIIMPTISH